MPTFSQNGVIYEELPDGNVRVVGYENQMPAKPGFPYEGSKAAAEAQQAQNQAAASEYDPALAAAKLEVERQNAATAASKEEREQAIFRATGGKPAQQIEEENKQAGRRDKANFIRAQVAKMWEMYNSDLKGNPASRAFGAAEYIDGLPANQRFTTAGQTLLGLIRPMIAQSAKEGDSDREMAAFEAYMPTNNDTDATIEFKLRSLEALTAGVIDGAMPSQIKTILDGGTDPRELAGRNADTQSKQVPPEYQTAYAAFVQSGDFTPEQYARFRGALDKQYFPNAGDQTDTYREEGMRILDDMRNGRPLNLNVPGVNEPLSGVDRFRNDAVNNPVGAGVADFANMGGFGIPEAFMGDQYAALRDEYPVGTTLGQIGGAITGTGAIGRSGKAALDAITRGAPRFGQQLARANPLARNLATDVAYSGAYGTITGDDPLSSMAQGAAGSLFGQGVGKVAGSAIRGVQATPAVQALRSSGVPLTIGQTVGGLTKSLEDKAMSLPGVGDMIRNRRIEGMEGFNRAAFKQAGEPLGFTPSEIGKEGVQQLFDAASGAYDNATAGVQATLDPKALSELTLARAMGQRMPPNMRSAYDTAMNNYIAPIEQAGNLTGDSYQQTVRALKNQRQNPPGPGFEQEYRDAMGANMGALRGAMERGGGQSTIEGLGRADQAYRAAKILEDATNRAAGGSQSGIGYVATPSQLQRAGMASARKFGGQSPFADLADAGQEVLPSQVPDSGTAGRIAAMAGGGALLGGGAGYAAGGDPGSAAQGALLMSLLAAGGTRKAQDLGIASIMNRPEMIRRAGQEIEKRRGLFGSASLPFMLVN